VLEALADGAAMTAGDVAAATGLPPSTVATTLSKLAKRGELLKAERGYQLPTVGVTDGAPDRPTEA
jgi:DNA-binding IclR family transcriptional regulator